MADIEPARFRLLLGRFVTGVTVVTAMGSDGEPRGMTANTLTSLSLNPPLISVCIDQASEMHETLERNTHFAVNILSAEQEAISRRFADEAKPRFRGIGFQRSESGAVVLDGVLAHLECERYASCPAGDHTIFIGRVIGGETRDRDPLVYYRGGYTGLSR